MNAVPNQFPSVAPTSYRIALVGEAPGKDEEAAGKPFVGMSGKLLDQLLSAIKVLRASCFVGNVCQLRPPNNDMSQFKLDGPEITSGLAQLRADLDKFNPNIIVLLGKTALWAASGLRNLSDWRGSVFTSSTLLRPDSFDGYKCLATYHPAACLRMYEFLPLLTFDLRRALKESYSPELVLPKRELVINLTYSQLISELNRILVEKPEISCDIEGGVGSLSCCSIATSSQRSFIVPFATLEGSNLWSIQEEVMIWRKFAEIMADAQIKKVWMNSLYDRFVLQCGYNIICRGSVEDIMLKHWELYCELEKSLAVQASIYTDEPYWKFEGKAYM